MKFDRAWRRVQNAYIKKNRKNYFSYSHWDDNGRKAGYLLNNSKRCSCYMCGNPRVYNKGKPEALTIQERRNDQKERGYHASNVVKDIDHEQNLPSKRCCRSLQRQLS